MLGTGQGSTHTPTSPGKPDKQDNGNSVPIISLCHQEYNTPPNVPQLRDYSPCPLPNDTVLHTALTLASLTVPGLDTVNIGDPDLNYLDCVINSIIKKEQSVLQFFLPSSVLLVLCG